LGPLVTKSHCFTVPARCGLGDVKPQQIYGVKDLARSSVSGADPAMVVRVMAKSRMLHYSKPGKNDKWPFQVS